MRYSNTIRRSAISAFILFHIVAIVSWSVPMNSLLFTSVKNKVAPYMLWSGLFQSWSFYSPDPWNLNRRLAAEITYRDGRMGVWQFPVPQDFGYVRRYFKGRWLSLNEMVPRDELAVLWTDAARYVARLHNDTNNPPVTVKLVRKWSEIAPPESGRAEPWQQNVFFVYSVKPGDLQ